MHKTATTIVILGSVLMLAACATHPSGPTVRVLPAPYKPFDVFQRETIECEMFADSQVSGQVERANNRAVGAAAVGTVLGLAVGAATGNGNAATFGAVAGGATGAAVGADRSDNSNYGIQRRYDIAYSQCMYSKGNQVPGYGRPQGAPPPPPRARNNAPPPPPERGDYYNN